MGWAKFQQRCKNFAAKLYFSISGSALKQGENLSSDGENNTSPAMSETLRRAAREGAVLLKNRNTLPISGKFALFGRGQTDTFYTGYGSGGDVIKPYRVSILQGLERGGAALVEPVKEAYLKFSEQHPVSHGCWGNWPRYFPEMPLSSELVEAARAETETAVVVLGRAAGEDRENELKAGSFYLTEEEKAMLARVTAAFPRVAVVLNIGSVIDLSFLEEYNISAALLLWQGGMEAGNACADLLLGKANPCGKLADTVARAYSAYPSSQNFGNAAYNDYAEDIFVGYRHFETRAKGDVRFPFGFGLSYTTFAISANYGNGVVKFCVKNTGERAGREVVQVYAEKPAAAHAPARELVGFFKTKELAPAEEEQGEIVLDDRAFSVYAEGCGFVQFGGTYRLYVGADVRSAEEIASFELQERIAEHASPLSYAVKIPPELAKTAKHCAFSDVAAGKATLTEFVASLSDRELEALAYGAMKMDSPLGASGNAGVMGGTTAELRARGVPPVTMTDGPSGIRLKTSSSLLPIATLLACTFDPALVEEVYRGVGEEMRARGSHVLLAPAMNMHRDPLCGRNFEYYSEDPLLSGKIAAAAVRGLQNAGVSACPKHFACNNQEFNRSHNDSRVSERALREIYLRGFEICVKEARPHFLMTSYNKINGVYAHYNAALVNGILRGEWGFEGCVITDWWMQKGSCPEAGKRKNNAARVYAGVNVLMPGGGYLGKKYQHGGLLKKLNKKGHLTRGELQKNACEILGAILKTAAMGSEKSEK